jgi:general L-amino acid transport system substrate-binding protein
MQRKLIPFFAFLIVAALLLAACGGASPTPSTGEGTVEETPADTTGGTTGGVPQAVETVIVTVEVPAAGGTPQVQVEVAQAPGFGETLEAVQSRGTLICGVNGQLPGFSFLDPEGNYSGFDVDFCRAVAAAVLGDANAVEFRPTTTQERFTVLQTGEIDVLMRNTTWTLSRDTDLGLNFTATTFYDGQGIMVPVDSGITTVEDLEGGTICVQTGTTTLQNLTDFMAVNGVNYEPAVFDDVNQTYGAYAEGRCDAATSDKSQLTSVARAVLPDPENHVILDLTLSKEPLGPAVRHGDDQWLDIVKWTIYATIAAEEYGVTSENVEDILGSTENQEILRLLGPEGELGPMLGLGTDWGSNVISQVGNYAEIYDRNLGENTATFIPRGLNSLYTDGGVLYAPPFR